MASMGAGRAVTDHAAAGTGMVDRACDRLGRLGPAAAFMCGLAFGLFLLLGVGLVGLSVKSLAAAMDDENAGQQPLPVPVTVEGPPSLLDWLTFASTLVALGIAVSAFLSDKRHAKQARQDMADQQLAARREALRQQLSYEVRGLVARLEDGLSRMEAASIDQIRGVPTDISVRRDPRLLRDLGTASTRARHYDYYIYRGLVEVTGAFWAADKAAAELRADGNTTERGRDAFITLRRASMNVNTWSRALESRLLEVEADPDMSHGEAGSTKPSLGWPEEVDIIDY